MSSASAQPSSSAAASGSPKRAGLVLISLILGALLCNVNLTVANVALPAIGTALDATQSQITLIAELRQANRHRPRLQQEFDRARLPNFGVR